MKRLLMLAGALLLSVLPSGVLGQSTQSTTVEYRWPDSLKGLQDNVKALLVKDGNIFAGTDSKYLWISSDTGKTWVQRDWRHGLNIDWGTVWSLAVTHSGKLLAGTYNGIYASTNNGNWWVRVSEDRTIIALLVTKSGAIFAGFEGIWRSTDDGSSWTQVADTSVALGVVSIAQTSSGVILAGSNDPFVSPSNKGIARSTDNGNTWTLSNAGLTQKSIVRVVAYPFGFSKEVFVVTYHGGSFKSTDEGLFWASITEIPEWAGGAAGVFPPLGVFLGFKTVNRDPLYHSFSSGWQTIPGLKGYMVLSLAQFSANQILVGTHDGVFLVTFGTTPVEPYSLLPTHYSLSQNYPNPFNPATTIEFSLPERSFVTLKVINLLGQEIETLLFGEKEAGSYRLVWNAGNLPSGIYFYKLETSKFQAVKKMLLMK